MHSEVLVYRGDVIESRHDISIAVVRSDGSRVASSGDEGLVAFWRSCAKPFQAVPSLVDGAADGIGLGAEELALACASHNGEPRHVDVARRMLERAGASEADLVCGPHASLDEPTAREMTQLGQRPTRLHNNCSGKHALMIAHAKHMRWGSDGYAEPAHPLQRSALDEVAAWTEMGAHAVPHATDGCGVPSFALPLSAMALAWARLGAAGAGRPVKGVSPASAAAMKRLVSAIVAHPFLVAGSRRLDTDLIEATRGKIVAKVGAEGVYCAAVPSLDIGIALKAEDGATRALSPALLGVLDKVATGLVPALAAHRTADIRNTLGVAVGHVEARINLDQTATKR